MDLAESVFDEQVRNNLANRDIENNEAQVEWDIYRSWLVVPDQLNNIGFPGSEVRRIYDKN